MDFSKNILYFRDMFLPSFPKWILLGFTSAERIVHHASFSLIFFDASAKSNPASYKFMFLPFVPFDTLREAPKRNGCGNTTS